MKTTYAYWVCGLYWHCGLVSKGKRVKVLCSYQTQDEASMWLTAMNMYNKGN